MRWLCTFQNNCHVELANHQINNFSSDSPGRYVKFDTRSVSQSRLVGSVNLDNSAGWGVAAFHVRRAGATGIRIAIDRRQRSQRRSMARSGRVAALTFLAVGPHAARRTALLAARSASLQFGGRRRRRFLRRLLVFRLLLLAGRCVNRRVVRPFSVQERLEFQVV